MESKEKKQKKKQQQKQFEFCNVCRRNHDQGRAHIYFPNHKKSLSSLLSSFLSKLSHIRSFLRYPPPTPPPPVDSSLWCIFCDSLISLPCENVIRHLASEEHLKNVRDFLRKYGGGMDRVESFGVSEAELLKWEKSCKSLKSASSSSKEVSRHTFEPSKDIHHELNSVTIDRFEKKSNCSFRSSYSDSVLPLQCYTNESYQVSHPEAITVANTGHVPCDAVPLSEGIQREMDIAGTSAIQGTGIPPIVRTQSQHNYSSNSRKNSTTYFHVDKRVQIEDGTEGNDRVFQNFTRIARSTEESIENVHTGAPPPWLEMGEESVINLDVSKDLSMNNFDPHSGQLQKSRKLNPKRVGAAWAEKRRIELEKERRGELVANNSDDNWLPNFGRVWQAGTRKESRREFEKEKEKLFKVENVAETSIEIQPYKSKRARRDEKFINTDHVWHQ